MFDCETKSISRRELEQCFLGCMLVSPKEIIKLDLLSELSPGMFENPYAYFAAYDISQLPFKTNQEFRWQSELGEEIFKIFEKTKDLSLAECNALGEEMFYPTVYFPKYVNEIKLRALFDE